MQEVIESNSHGHRLPSRFLAIKLLENDDDFSRGAGPVTSGAARRLRTAIEGTRGRPAESVIMSDRHDRAMKLFEHSATVSRPRPDPRTAMDSLFTHPLWGYVFLAVILEGFFWVVLGIGSVRENAVSGRINLLTAYLLADVPKMGLKHALVAALMDGVQGGAGIVLPYLIPFLFGLAFLEDVGYLPRVAYLMDGMLHRIGLHGSSMLPIILGYGCSVPACMATRILPSKPDRFLASVLPP